MYLKENKLMLVAVALIVYSATMGLVIAQNQSGTETLPTGQESVPVENTEGQTQQVAPADSIVTIMTTVFTIAIPAVAGLIISIATLIKAKSKDKKIDENADRVIAAAEYVDTLAPKIHEQYVASGAAKTALDIIIPRLAPEDQKMLKSYTDKIPDADQKIKELAAQLKELRSRLPKEAIADNDPKIPRTIDNTV